MKNSSQRFYRAMQHAMAAGVGQPGIRKRIPGKQAPLLTGRDIKQVEKFILEHKGAPYADLLKFRLTLYAGLRCREVALLSIADIVEPDGTISKVVRVRREVGKGRKERSIPMHPKLTEAVAKFREVHPNMDYVAFSQQWYTPSRQSPSVLASYFYHLYKDAGLPTHSSHSGRRTFITNLARKVGKGYTLRDVQLLAGHARLETTQRYIEQSENLAGLVEMLK
ncbi:tyrosine-type recombinase/integrase [Aurantiacibacter hainanensis]|uniref:tyrosine-type recombinase/integrase n=1 Tax=Aurantiacibacter hainanensis TaxID=3076114 RepID=UPI0030C772B8